MKTAIVLASIAASASAFAPAKHGASVTRQAATKKDLEAIAEKANPILKFYDPLNLAEADFYGMGTEATIGFLRHSEIKVSGMGFRMQYILAPVSLCISSHTTARSHCHVRLRGIHCSIQLRLPMAPNSCGSSSPFR